MNKDTVKNALAALHEMQLVSNDNRAKGAKWKVQLADLLQLSYIGR